MPTVVMASLDFCRSPKSLKNYDLLCPNVSQRRFYQQINYSYCCTHLKNSSPLMSINKGHIKDIFALGKFISHAPERRSIEWEDVLSDGNRKRWLQTVSSVAAIRSIKPQSKSENKRGSEVATAPIKVRQSAVLIPMCHVSGELCLLYTVRSRTLRSHSGEVSFPGGMADRHDEGDAVRTALREAHEEIGLVPSDVDVWGQTQALPSRFGGSMISGVLAYIGDIDIEKLLLNPNEVSSVFAVSLKNLCQPENFDQTQFRSDKMKHGGYSIPVFHGGAHRIWGVTGIFTHVTLKALLPGLYNHNLTFIPQF